MYHYVDASVPDFKHNLKFLILLVPSVSGKGFSSCSRSDFSFKTLLHLNTAVFFRMGSVTAKHGNVRFCLFRSVFARVGGLCIGLGALHRPGKRSATDISTPRPLCFWFLTEVCLFIENSSNHREIRKRFCVLRRVCGAAPSPRLYLQSADKAAISTQAPC